MKTSLRAKAVVLILLVAVLFSAVGIFVSGLFIRRMVDSSYRQRANEISSTGAAMLDPADVETLWKAVFEVYNATDDKVTSDDWGSEAFEAYIAHFEAIEQMPEFISLREQLRRIQDVNDVDCMYLMSVDIPTESCVYLVDAAYEDACPPGCIDPLYEENRELLTNPGRGFLPYITNTEAYGELVSAGVPIYDGAGNVLTYAMTDISMNVLRAQQASFTRTLSLILAAMTILTSMAVIWIVNRAIIRPINQLSRATASYSAGQADSSDIDTLTIHTRDEIQSLYASIRQMMHDINGYIENLMSTTQELTQTRLKADQMDALAHKDALTGVGSKLAYDQQAEALASEIASGEARFGIVMADLNFLKHLNDTYGHEKGNLAIRKTCAVLCDVFKHSPVYRIGGDEFVVVVKGRDYDDVEALVQQFKDDVAVLSGEPWERISAAIGYALYNGEDSVDDVFRNADHVMYEHKKELHARRMK